MRHPELEPMLRELAKKLEDHYGHRLRYLVLYGSQARGDTHVGSDINVLVILDNLTNLYREIAATSKVIAEISEKYFTFVNCKFANELDFLLKSRLLPVSVRRDGIVFYEKSVDIPLKLPDEVWTTHPHLAEVLSKFADSLRQLYGTRLAALVLYGSQARGDARKYSDINVLVVLDCEIDVSTELDRTGEITENLWLRYDARISRTFTSAVDYLAGTDSFLISARKEGVVLYERGATAMVGEGE